MARSLISIALLVACLLGPGFALADDVQIIPGSWNWPDQGVGCMDPNGDTDWCAKVNDLHVYQGRLIVGGVFFYAGGQPINGLAAWDGSTWSRLEGGGAALGVTALFGLGNDLYVAGGFTTIDGVEARNLARWDGTAWHDVGGGVGGGGVANAFAWWDDGSGPALFVAGGFGNAGNPVIGVSRVAKWDGVLWHPLGSGCSGPVEDLDVFDDGTGPALYAGGGFQKAGGKIVNGIAKWDGQQWHSLGQGVTDLGRVNPRNRHV